jgi:hypothetical protein
MANGRSITNMKRLRNVLSMILIVSACRAALPDDVSGFVFHETTQAFRARDKAGYCLNPDGRYVGLYLAVVATSGPFGYSKPSAGTWKYKKLSADTAELTLLPDLANPEQTAARRTLNVASESGGSFSGGGSIITLPSGSSFGSFLQTFRLSSPSAPMPLSNCSSRGYVRGGTTAIMGFVITDQTRAVLVRAVGPGLAALRVQDTLTDPRLRITGSGTDDPMVNDNWDKEPGSITALERAAQLVGAFPLVVGSKDSAIVVVLPPGGYTAQVTGGSPVDSGEVLIEVYALP